MKRMLFVVSGLFFCVTSFAQTASFTFLSTNGLFCNPTNINFAQTCTGNPIAFSWNFGNGQTSTSPNPNITFTSGTYVVRLTAFFPNQAITAQETIIISPAVTVNLTGDKNYLCQPGIVNFTAAGTGGISAYEWTFGDGNIATTTTNTISHTYLSLGNFQATVKATNPSGCSAISPFFVNIQRPPITASVFPFNGCIPQIANFSASAILPVGDVVTNYAWDFGDGSPVINTAVGTTNHPYTIVGTYLPTLTITTRDGCSNIYNYPAIGYGTPPTGLVASSDKLVYCGSETPVFTATATNADSYIWNFGDGTITTTTSNTITHRFLTLGTKTVMVAAFYNGCVSNILSLQIDIVGVIGGFSYTNSCTNKNTFTFTNTTQGNQSTILWDFGDGSPTVSTLNATHAFPPSGSFVTRLTVTDNLTGCSDNFSATIYTATPTLSSSANSVCRNDSVRFTINNDYTNPAKSYTWNVNGTIIGPNMTNPFSVQAPILGNYNTNFVVINNGPQYCPDTVNLPAGIVVRGPDLSYTMPASICLNDTLRITNTSVPYVPADLFAINYWNYGNTTTNDTIYQPPPIMYTVPATYDIKFYAQDINGCSDSLIKPLVVNPLPFLNVIPQMDTVCEGSSVPLIAFHTDNILWSPPVNLSCTVCDTTYASPALPTTYFATASNSFGCSVVDSSVIQVINDFTASPVLSPVFICVNDSITINVLPPGKIISWLPSTNISNVNAYNPIVYPKINTTYTATLSDTTGCFTRTASIQVNMKSLPTVDAGPDKFVPYNSRFTISPIYGLNAASYSWSPPGNLNCTTCPVVNGTALDKQVFEIKVTSDSNCVATDSITIFVDCKEANIHMPSAFTPNDDGNNDYYYPLTRGIKIIKKFMLFNRAGKLVFSRSNFLPNIRNLGWDGKYNGTALPMGSYVYVLEATCFNNRDVGLNGMVTLLR